MDFYLGMILPSALRFVPSGFLPCDGRLLDVQSNAALFSLIGNTYGGDGIKNFALPDLRGRVVVGANPAPESQNSAPEIANTYLPGAKGGVEAVTLLSSQMPVHNHTISVASATADQNAPAGNYLAAPNGMSGSGPHATPVTVNSYANAASNPVQNLAPNSVGASGSSQPHSNLQPYQVLNWIICTQGIYPSRP
jgi:microcystin-dependent protein